MLSDQYVELDCILSYSYDDLLHEIEFAPGADVRLAGVRLLDTPHGLVRTQLEAAGFVLEQDDSGLRVPDVGVALTLTHRSKAYWSRAVAFRSL